MGLLLEMTFIKTIHRALIVAVCLCAVSSALTTYFNHAEAQPQRDRRVATEPTPTPVPSPATSPGASRSVSPSRSVPNSLADLKSRIEEIVRQPGLEPGIFAVKIVSLDTGLLIYEQSANKFVRPASNMKLYTVAAALERLTPDYHFITSVYAKEKPDKGTVKGDLIIYGRGDPSIAASFNNSDYFKGINDF